MAAHSAGRDRRGSAPMNMLELYPTLLFTGLVATSASAIGLLSVWAGLGRGHWFMRLAAVGAVLALGIFIPAYDLILLFFAQAAVVILTLFVVRGVSGRGGHQTGGDPGSGVAVRKARFALADLLLAMAVAGGIFAVSANVPKEVWVISPELTILGASLGAVTLAAAWAALGRGRTLVCLALACIVTVVGALWTTIDSSGLVSMAAAAGLIALGLLLGRVSANRGHGDRPIGSRKIAKRSLLAVRLAQLVLIAVIVLPPACTLYYLSTPPPIPDTPLPKPNAYDDLVQLGGAMPGAWVPDGAPVEVLRPFVARYGPILDRARTALARESAVPVDYLSPEHPVERGTALRDLCRVLAAEANLAAHEGDMTRAVRSAVNCVQLGHAAARGGVVTDRLYGAAFEMIGISELGKVRHRLSAPECREVAQDLAALETAWEPLDLVFVRDKAWSHHGWGWHGRLLMLFNDLAGDSPDPQRLHVRSDQRNRAFMRLLICDLGVRAFQLENGKLPRDLGQLVPDYLPSVPEDPFSGGPLVYRLEADGHVLYSIGPNRKDDGGRADFDDGDIVLGMYDTPASSSTGP